ncbi:MULTISPECIES: polysaccharide deacetylase family protein [unclassified Streptomyces]|uniref:polysaccharide deacetylase family protein n=1 Tax=unclassified Streptomyces TaxID=2593676 RepID=UPI003D75D366
MRREEGRGGTAWVAVTAAVVTVVGASVLGVVGGSSADGAAIGRPGDRIRPVPAPASPTPPAAPRPAPGQTSVPDPALAAPAVSMDIAHASDGGPHAVNITIDDGPDPRWTPRVLKVLRDNGVKAVFCMVGPRAAEHPALVRQIVAEGHRLCDHSVRHDTTMDRKSRSFQRAEITDAAGMIERASGGVKPLYYRAPGGSFTPYSRQIAAAMGMRPLGWNVDTDDYKRPGTRTIVNTVERELPNGPTILFHDGGGDRSQTVAALAELLPRLRQQGYAFGFPVR